MYLSYWVALFLILLHQRSSLFYEDVLSLCLCSVNLYVFTYSTVRIRLKRADQIMYYCNQHLTRYSLQQNTLQQRLNRQWTVLGRPIRTLWVWNRGRWRWQKANGQKATRHKANRQKANVQKATQTTGQPTEGQPDKRPTHKMPKLLPSASCPRESFLRN